MVVDLKFLPGKLDAEGAEANARNKTFQKDLCRPRKANLAYRVIRRHPDGLIPCCQSFAYMLRSFYVIFDFV